MLSLSVFEKEGYVWSNDSAAYFRVVAVHSVVENDKASEEAAVFILRAEKSGVGSISSIYSTTPLIHPIADYS